MKIGIDTSTTNTAIVVLDNQNKIIRFELLSPKDKDIIVRSRIICKDILHHFHNLDPAYVKIGIEGASFGSIGKKDKLVMLMGYIYYHLLVEGYDVKLLPPSTIKKQFTGNGRAKKEEMIACLPLDVKVAFEARYKKIDDLADSYAICMCL